MKRQTHKVRNMIISILSFSLFLLIWEIATDYLEIWPSYILPSPVKVVQTFIQKLSIKAPDGSTLFQNIGASLSVALTGYLLGSVVGIPLGIAMGWYRKFDNFFRPIFDLIRPIPTIGWIPIMVLLLGIGLKAKAAIIFLSAVVPCIINAYAGIKLTKPVHIWVAQTFGASDFTILWKVAIPTAMPLIFTGLRISLGSSWMTLVAAELLASNKGLGYMIQMGRMLARPDIIIVGMLTIGIIGALLSFVIEKLEKLLVRGGRSS